jgi:hypothetical protein
VTCYHESDRSGFTFLPTSLSYNLMPANGGTDKGTATLRNRPVGWPRRGFLILDYKQRADQERLVYISRYGVETRAYSVAMFVHAYLWSCTCNWFIRTARCKWLASLLGICKFPCSTLCPDTGCTNLRCFMVLLNPSKYMQGSEQLPFRHSHSLLTPLFDCLRTV